MTKFNGKFSEDIVKEVRKDFEREDGKSASRLNCSGG